MALPLAGLKVLELARILAGPWAGQILADLGAAQCGYCTPAMLLTAMALLDRNPNPSRQAIKDALSGVLCRCTGYVKIFEAVELAASRGAAGG